MSRVIRAAGGLVFRETPKGRVKVLVAHRPGYDDWGLPKGKADPGETPEQTALREVLEETGYLCRIIAPLPTTRHRTNGSIKEVTWYAMRPLPQSPGFAPNSEVDEVRWLAPHSALKLVDYTNDEYLITTSDFESLRKTGTIRVVRHALAGDRGKWKGDDVDRPLTKKGRRQVAGLIDSLSPHPTDVVISSPYRRCVETARPLAKAAGVKLVIDPRLAEGAEPNALADLATEMAGQEAIVCAHGEQILELLADLKSRGADIEGKLRAEKGSTWELRIEAGQFVSARYHRAPTP